MLYHVNIWMGKSFRNNQQHNIKSADEKEVMSPTRSNWDRYQKIPHQINNDPLNNCAEVDSQS